MAANAGIDAAWTGSCSAWRWRRDDFAAAVGVHGGHDSRGLHGLDHSGGTVVADAQLALYGGNRSLARLGDEGDRLIVEGVVLFTAILIATEATIVTLIGALGDVLDIDRLATGFPVGDNAVHLVITDEGTMHTGGDAATRWQEQHVTMAQQLFRPTFTQDSARIDLGLHHEGQT